MTERRKSPRDPLDELLGVVHAITTSHGASDFWLALAPSERRAVMDRLLAEPT